MLQLTIKRNLIKFSKSFWKNNDFDWWLNDKNARRIFILLIVYHVFSFAHSFYSANYIINQFYIYFTSIIVAFFINNDIYFK